MTMWVILEDLGNFSPKKEKNLGEQKIHVFRRRIFADPSEFFVVVIVHLMILYKSWRLCMHDFN